MADEERGVGISWKLPDGTMIWVKREDWVEVEQEIKLIKGEDYLNNLRSQLKGGGSSSVSATPPAALSTASTAAPPSPAASEKVLSPEEVAQELGGTASSQTFAICAACGALKDRLVPAGKSKKTGKPYPAFYGCPTRGCPGK